MKSSECGPSLVPVQDLDTMEESSEIKVGTGISKTSRIQSFLAANGKRVRKALGYITGEMKEFGERLRGKASRSSAPLPAPVKVPLLLSPRKHAAQISVDVSESHFHSLAEEMGVSPL